MIGSVPTMYIMFFNILAHTWTDKSNRPGKIIRYTITRHETTQNYKLMGEFLMNSGGYWI